MLQKFAYHSIVCEHMASCVPLSVLQMVAFRTNAVLLLCTQPHALPFFMRSPAFLQMVACVGQQSVGGKRAFNGFKDRTLPHFPRGDKTPAGAPPGLDSIPVSVWARCWHLVRSLGDLHWPCMTQAMQAMLVPSGVIIAYIIMR